MIWGNCGMKNLDVRVINLDRSKDRLQTIGKSLKIANLPFDRFAARDMTDVDLSEIPLYNEAKAKRSSGRPLSRGEVGCYLSHLGCLEDFLASDANYLLVLEDDAVVPADLMTWLPDTVRDLTNVLGENWHCLNLSNAYPKRRRFLLKASHFELYRAFYFPVLTSALVWSRSGATSFMAAPEASMIWGPVDVQFRKVLCRTGGGISTDVPPIPQSGVQSEIGGENRSKSGRRKILPHLRLKLPDYAWANYNKFISSF